MREKRKVERFDLQIETMLNVLDESIMDKTLILLSRDISCNGVYLTTENTLPIDTRLDLNVLLNQYELSSQSDERRINISASGKVVRINEQGMAVEFDKLFNVSHLKLQP